MHLVDKTEWKIHFIKERLKKTDEEIVILTAGEKDFCHYTSGRSRQNL